MLKSRRVPNAFWSLCQNTDVKRGSQSDTIDTGTPYNLKISFTSVLWNSMQPHQRFASYHNIFIIAFFAYIGIVHYTNFSFACQSYHISFMLHICHMINLSCLFTYQFTSCTYHNNHII